LTLFVALNILSVSSYELSLEQWLLFALVGLLVGMSKVGVSGVAMIAVPILAIIFGGRNSTGIMLPILIMADFFGAFYYRRHAQWGHLKKLLPPAVIGVLLGTYIGQFINDELFKLIMGIIIFSSVGILIWLERSSSKKVPHEHWFAIIIGTLLGFTTMVGNLAGAVMALYLLVMNMSKNMFIGTVAWFFIIINIFKVPFHVFFWKTIDLDTLLLDLTLLPVVALGAFVGIRIVKQISETGYRYFIIAMTVIAAIFMIIN
jgi:uncharacterized membrane protein YfcA